MTRPRVSLGLEASRPTLNGPVCADLGRQLAQRRQGQGLTVEQAAQRLLLTPRQVHALESVSVEAFYGADFFVIALRKYAALMGLDPAVASEALVPPGPAGLPPPSKAVPAPTVIARPHPSPRSRTSGTLTWLAVAAVVVMATGVASVMFWPPRPKAVAAGGVKLNRQPPPTDIPTSEPLSAPAAAPAASAPELEPALVAPNLVAAADAGKPGTQLVSLPMPGAGVGQVTVARRTWVFVRYGDNTTVTRGLAPGEAFVLQDMPTYLAVGAAEDTSVIIGGHAIDNAQYTVNGQLRVRSSQLARLTTQQQ